MVRPPKTSARTAPQPTSAMGPRPAPGRADLFRDRRGSSAISHLALCGGLCTLATVVAAAVDPSAQEAAGRLGGHLVGVMNGQTTSSPESTPDERARLDLPYRPNRGRVNHAQANDSRFTGALGDYLAELGTREGGFGQDSFKSADGTVPKQVQMAGWPLIPLLAGGGGTTAGGAAAGGAAATVTAGIFAYLGITNMPEEVGLSLASPVLAYRELVLSFVNRTPGRPKVLATYPDDLSDLTKPLGGTLPEPIPPILVTPWNPVELDKPTGFDPSWEQPFIDRGVTPTTGASPIFESTLPDDPEELVDWTGEPNDGLARPMWREEQLDIIDRWERAKLAENQATFDAAMAELRAKMDKARQKTEMAYGIGMNTAEDDEDEERAERWRKAGISMADAWEEGDREGLLERLDDANHEVTLRAEAARLGVLRQVPRLD